MRLARSRHFEILKKKGGIRDCQREDNAEGMKERMRNEKKLFHFRYIPGSGFSLDEFLIIEDFLDFPIVRLSEKMTGREPREEK